MKLTLKETEDRVTFEPLSCPKTFHQQISVTDSSLKDKVMAAFHLAKSAGQELNVTFIANPRNLR